MSSNLFKRTELIINLAIVVVALLLGGTLVKRYLFTTPEAAESRNVDPRIVPGTKISMPGMDWAKNRQSLLVVVSTQCHFCSESAPFYRQLSSELVGGKVQIIAVVPQEVSAGKEYLSSLDVPINDVRQMRLDSLGVNGTPTLILVDKTGSVINSWVGKLPPDKESEVLSQLQTLIADE